MNSKSKKSSKSDVLASAVQTTVEQLPVGSINDSVAKNARVRSNKDTVADYAEKMDAGEKFPPVRVFAEPVKDNDGNDSVTYWLGDGWHRLEAHRVNNYKVIDADVSPGTQRDAILHSLTANAKHGLQRSNSDKRHAVLILLNDAKWSKQSDRSLAKLAGVSQPFVSGVRKELAGADGEISSDAAIKAAADNGGESEGDGGEKEDAAPKSPFDEFNVRLEAIVSNLTADVKELAGLFGYDPATKAFTSRFAAGYSVAGTVGQLRSIVAALKDGTPVSIDGDRIVTRRESKLAAKGKPTEEGEKTADDGEKPARKGKGKKATDGADAAPDSVVAATEGQAAN